MKLTRVEEAVMQVIRMRGAELTSLEIYQTLKPIAFGRIHAVLDSLERLKLIEIRREEDKRIVRCAAEKGASNGV